MSVERWLPVPGWNAYEVSDLGRVRRVRAGRGTRVGLLRLNHQGRGYLNVTLNQDGRRWTMRVHRLVMLAFVGPMPEDHSVDHRDVNPANNALTNLRYVPVSQNSYEALMRRHYGPARTDWAA